MEKGITATCHKIKLNGLDSVGMVTSATWADMNGDGQNDLVVTGKWMSTRIYIYKNGRFEELKSNLNSLFGMWEGLL